MVKGLAVGKYEKYAVAFIFIFFSATLAPWAFDFPLNDDWAYGMAVRTLSETGRLTLCDWGSSTQVMHIIAGALFTKFFGFSFATLRAANVLLAAGGIFMFMKLLDEFEIGPFEKIVAGLALCLNPLYLVLANSFMTDMHYFFWTLCASYFYVRRLKNPQDSSALVWAGVCSAAAYLTRQIGVALPFAFMLTLLASGRFKWKDLWKTWAIPGAAILGYYLWFTRMHGPTWASENYVAAATLAHLSKPGAFINDSFFRLFSSVLETGMLLLPLAAGYVFSLRKFSERNLLQCRVSSSGPWIALGAMAVFAFINGPLPYLENSLAHSGIGTLTLAGAQLKPSGLFSSQLFWIGATAAAALSAVLLMCSSSLALRAGKPALWFVFLSCLSQLGIALIGAKYFDRYLLTTLLPWFAVTAAFAARGVRFSKPAAIVAVCLCAFLSWAGMKDYLAWNGAKWELATKPRTGLSPDEIANGFDYDAWFNYEKNMSYLKTMKPLSMIGEWEWKKMTRYKAVVAFSPNPRLKILDKAEYSTPLSSRKGILYLMSLNN